MQRMGYKRVLYFDSSILPSVNLQEFFDVIKEKGYFITKNFHKLDYSDCFMREEVARYFGYSLLEATNLDSCSACVFGVDFTNEKAAKLIDALYEAAKDPNAFYSARSDQTALTLLLYRLGMTDWLSGPYSPYFIMDRAFVKDPQ
jgi:hypothetical protein